jgi:hypothetical protein
MSELIIESEADLLELAYSLGKPVSSRLNGPLIDNLIPLKKEDAHKQSLSAICGIEPFPFHTDGAYFEIPPRFIILRYIQGIENPSPTIVCNLNKIQNLDKEKLKYSVWKVKSRELTFLSSILSDNEMILRYDKCVMQPMNLQSDNSFFLEKLISEQPKLIINWTQNKTVIIDNWSCLHSRPKVKDDEINFRNIQRIMIL